MVVDAGRVGLLQVVDDRVRGAERVRVVAVVRLSVGEEDDELAARGGVGRERVRDDADRLAGRRLELDPHLRAVGREGQPVVERLDSRGVVQQRRDVVGQHPLQRRTHPAAARGVRAIDGGETKPYLRIELGHHRLDRHLEVVPRGVGHVGADGVAGGPRQAVEHAAGAIDEQVDGGDLRHEFEVGRLAGGVGARVADRRPARAGGAAGCGFAAGAGAAARRG